METVKQKKAGTIAKLVIGSLIGICFFMLPFSYKDSMTIPLAFLKDLLSAPLKPAMPYVVMALAAISAFGALYVSLNKKDTYSKFVKSAFGVSPLMLVLRFVALAITIMTVFSIGPKEVWDGNTGGVMVLSLIPSLFFLFLCASIALPLLTEYGAMELVGSVLQPVFKPLFRLPGRSAVLAVSSWFGNGTIGMLTTEDEYKKGYYTGREAALICLCFCIITFPSVFIYSTSIAGLEITTFGYYFFTLVVIGVISAIILSRIPPFTCIPDEYYEGRKNPELDEVTANGVKGAFDLAYSKAEKAPGIVEMVKNGVVTSFRMYMIVFPLIIVLGTVVLIIAEFTPVFGIIATPLVPLLNAMGIPEASTVAPSLLIGFADLLLPFLAATSLQSQLAKFIVCVIGTIQVICMSESGTIMIKSEIPVKFWHLVLIFIERTIIAVPIALLMGRLFGLS